MPGQPYARDGNHRAPAKGRCQREIPPPLNSDDVASQIKTFETPNAAEQTTRRRFWRRRCQPPPSTRNPFLARWRGEQRRSVTRPRSEAVSRRCSFCSCARLFERRSYVIRAGNARAGDLLLKNDITFLEPTIGSRALRLDLHDDNAFLACGVGALPARRNRQTEARNVCPVGQRFTVVFRTSALASLALRQ